MQKWMSRAATVGWTVAITAPIAAWVTLAVERLRRRDDQSVELVAEYGIRNVPAKRPHWGRAASAPERMTLDHSVVLPAQDPHAPPTITQPITLP